MVGARAQLYHLLFLDELLNQLSEEHLKRQILIHVQDRPITPCIQLCLDLIVTA